MIPRSTPGTAPAPPGRKLQRAAILLLSAALLAATFSHFMPWRANVKETRIDPAETAATRTLYHSWGVENRVTVGTDTRMERTRSWWDDSHYRPVVTTSTVDGRRVTTTREVGAAIPFLLKAVLPLHVLGTILAFGAAALWALAPDSRSRDLLATLAGVALLWSLIFLLVGTDYLLTDRGADAPPVSPWIALPALATTCALAAAYLPRLVDHGLLRALSE